MRLKLGQKIISGYFLIIAFLVLVGYFGIKGMNAIEYEYGEVNTHRTISTHIWELSNNYNGQFAHALLYIQKQDQAAIDEFNELEAETEEVLAETRKLDLSNEEKEKLERIAALDEEFCGEIRQVFQLVSAGNMAAAQASMKEIEEDIDQIDVIIHEWDGTNDKSVEEHIAMAEEGSHSAMRNNYVVMAVAAIFGILAGLLISRSISKPVMNLAAAAGQIAKGDLSVSIPDVRTKDEVQTLNEAFRTMLSNLRELISKVNDSAQNVAATSEELSTNSDEAAKATQQVANAIQEVARGASQQTSFVTGTMDTVGQVNSAIGQIASGAQEQANNITSTADMVTQMAASIEEVASGAQTVTQSAEKTKVAADKGEQSVEQTIKGMEGIKGKVFESANKIRELGEHSQQIGEIIQVIDDIAEQTNLLALNAAIEAARAGEHGKGFAVVADEVRKLAERSGKATKEIAELITNIQKLTAEAVTAMEQGTGEVEQGVWLAHDAGNALKEILRNVEETYRQVQNISAAAEEISASSQEVVKAVDNVSSITEENTAATEQLTAASSQVGAAMESISSVTEETSAAAQEVSASTEEMTASIEEISSASQTLAAMAEELREMVARFRL
ncbi:MAG: hypothetical protein CVU89_15515 [Firmicutes bacterium HGW-Firmicutes-14]|nr:MAG: hypothetical protein CVU89_15515 [Firmicutes bacterium HGW-Firmicutes-14]